MCECRYVHLCPSGHLPFRAPGPQKFKNFPSPRPPEKSKIFTPLPTPFPPLSNPSHAFIRRPPPGRNGSGRPPRGSGGSWLRHNGPGGRDGGSRGLTGGSGGVEGVSRVWGGGSPCDWGGSGLGSRDSPGGRGEGVARGSPCDGVGSGLDFRDSPLPAPARILRRNLSGTCWVLVGYLGGEKCREKMVWTGRDRL
jgi:hypothetical protein